MEEVFSSISPANLYAGSDNNKQSSCLHLEENTIDPRSPLPSFIEICHYVHDSVISLQDTLLLCIDSCSSRQAHSRIDSDSTYFEILVKSLSRLVNKYKLEFLALLVFKFELVSLQRCDATISESMFGLKRVRVTSGNQKNNQIHLSQISEVERVKSASSIALLAYLRYKLPQLWNDWKTNDEEYMTNSSFSRFLRARKLFVTLFPFLHMTAEGTQLFYYFQYLFNQSIYATPLLHLLGTAVRRVALSDGPKETLQSNNTNTNSATSSRIKQNSIFSIAASTVAIIYGYNWMLHFWRKQRLNRRQTLLSQEQRDNNISMNYNKQSIASLIPPPKKVEPIEGHNTIMNPALCPICGEDRVHPTACSYGYVFCYRCITMHLRSHHKCPVTGLKCLESHLVQLRDN